MQNAGPVFAWAIALSVAWVSPGDAATAASAIRMIDATTPHFLTIDDRGYYDEDFDEEDQGDDPPPPVARGYPQPAEGDLIPEWLPPPRPANCGEYKYWNGTYCADAREQPPYVGPRW
jgi:hypothetical protein